MHSSSSFQKLPQKTLEDHQQCAKPVELGKSHETGCVWYPVTAKVTIWLASQWQCIEGILLYKLNGLRERERKRERREPCLCPRRAQQHKALISTASCMCWSNYREDRMLLIFTNGKLANGIVKQMLMWSVIDDEPHCAVTSPDQTCASTTMFCWW